MTLLKTFSWETSVECNSGLQAEEAKCCLSPLPSTGKAKLPGFSLKFIHLRQMSFDITTNQPSVDSVDLSQKETTTSASDENEASDVLTRSQWNLWAWPYKGSLQQIASLWLCPNLKTPTHCTMCCLLNRNSSGLLAPGDILKNPQKYLGKRHFFSKLTTRRKNEKNQLPWISNSRFQFFLKNVHSVVYWAILSGSVFDTEA